MSPTGTLELFLGIDAAVREFLLRDRVALDVAKAGFEAHRTFNSIERRLASTPDGALLSVSLSLPRINVLQRVISLFQKVNDPYIAERIYGAAYGCTLRAVDDSSLAVTFRRRK